MAVPEIQFEHFYTYAEICSLLHDLAEAYPDLCKIGTLGTSRDGRDIPLLTLTDFSVGQPEDRPAILIHGGIHAHEPASAHAPLYTATRLLQDHGPDGLLSRVAFIIIPRLTVDASDFCILTSTRIRSRTDFQNRDANVIYPEDLDQNGLILTVRQPHPDGGFTIDPKEPRLLIRRHPDSPGPYYRTFPEGLIYNWDGRDEIRQAGLDSFLPQSPELTGGRSYDWNRNWPHSWRADQIGAGEHPLSEPEVNQLYTYLRNNRRIFAVIGYHCGKASVIRPPASGSRSDLDPSDDQRLQTLAEIAAALTQTPILSLVGPGNPGKGGHSLDTIHRDLGRLAFELELGTILSDAGLSHEDAISLDETGEEAWMRRLMKWWDDRGQDIPLYEPWKSFTHPQLGNVELGGLHYTSIDNPLISGLAATLEGRHQFTLELASRHP
jgi:hypothetical protein